MAIKTRLTRSMARSSDEAAAPVMMGQLRSRAFSHPETAAPEGHGSMEQGSSAGFDAANISVLSPSTPVQAKLTVGQPGDKYEQEADAVAAKVVNQIHAPQSSAQAGAVQREAMAPEKEEELAQMKPELQREAMPEEEEETLQAKPDLQREVLPEEEENLQKKTLIQTKASGGMAASQPLETAISGARGQGQPLSDETRGQMEGAFGADFGGVRVHTDGRSDQLNQSLQARAFTTGQDIFFKRGEYRPGDRGGQELLAHELTHVAQQQSGARRADTPVQRSATREVLQCQPITQQANSEIKFRIGWLTDEGSPVETNGQVAALARLAITFLQEGLGDVSSDRVKTQVTDWIAWAKWAIPYFDKHAGEKVGQDIIPLINHQYDELLEIQEAVRIDKVIQIKEALWREHDAAVKAAEEAEALQPALDDALRAAYRKGSSSTVKEVVSTVKGALSVGRSIRTLAADITKDIMGLPLGSGTKIYVDHWTSQIGRPKITIINVGKYTEMLSKLGRGLSALNIVLTIADRSKKATEAEQGMKDLSDTVNIGTDLITVLGLSAPPHFSLYTTLYLKSALKVISKQIGVLVDNLSDVNRTAVEVTGDLMYPNVEPGGQEMFDLMIKVMHANHESGFPVLPSGVKEYLFNHREKLSIGAEADVSTEGIWFWEHLDGSAGRRWLFVNRKRVWAMFYGSMKVPAGKR